MVNGLIWVAGFSAGRAATGVRRRMGAGYHIEQGDVSYAIVSYDLVGFSSMW